MSQRKVSQSTAWRVEILAARVQGMEEGRVRRGEQECWRQGFQPSALTVYIPLTVPLVFMSSPGSQLCLVWWVQRPPFKTTVKNNLSYFYWDGEWIRLHVVESGRASKVFKGSQSTFTIFSLFYSFSHPSLSVPEIPEVPRIASFWAFWGFFIVS